jgi:hypothetical protein
MDNVQKQLNTNFAMVPVKVLLVLTQALKFNHLNPRVSCPNQPQHPVKNFGQRIRDKVWSYWERLQEHIWSIFGNNLDLVRTCLLKVFYIVSLTTP